ncbi:Electron transfer flavoprotein alpha-subunit [Perkinsus chesapeaki]|uniref:Electron transfer flavoprotein alpha-subunit n=1 Tax=Perkinsus chesapeaki TaxID=330153 RepID=A0A7J6MWE9_PERCH|nr:Electron transfer flavoprotein alpha-subunit [Perkinsus chesapeaki]
MDTAISVDATELRNNEAFVEALLQAPEIPSEPGSPGDKSPPRAENPSNLAHEPYHVDDVRSEPVLPLPPPPPPEQDSHLAVQHSGPVMPGVPIGLEVSDEMALAIPSKRARRGSLINGSDVVNEPGAEEGHVTAVVQLKSGPWRAQIAIGGKKYRGPTRRTPEEADNDRIQMEEARQANTLEQLLQDWEMTSQLLPKGVYYNKSKKAFIATIHQQVSFVEADHLDTDPTVPRAMTMKYEGPARHNVEEAIQDRIMLEAAQSPEQVQEVLARLRRPKQEKRRTPSKERIPTGVHLKKDGFFTAQVSVHRKNFRGPPRTSLEEAVDDRQRLTQAKEEGRVDEVWSKMKEEYAQLQQLRRLTTTATGIRSLRGPGRPRGSVTRIAHVPLPDLSAALPPPGSQPSFIPDVVPSTVEEHEAIAEHADSVVKLDVSHFECASSHNYNAITTDGAHTAESDEPAAAAALPS